MKGCWPRNTISEVFGTSSDWLVDACRTSDIRTLYLQGLSPPECDQRTCLSSGCPTHFDKPCASAVNVDLPRACDCALIHSQMRPPSRLLSESVSSYSGITIRHMLKMQVVIRTPAADSNSMQLPGMPLIHGTGPIATPLGYIKGSTKRIALPQSSKRWLKPRRCLDVSLRGRFKLVTAQPSGAGSADSDVMYV